MFLSLLISVAAASSQPNWQAHTIGSDQAKAAGLTGKGVTIAIIDSGLDLNRYSRNLFTNPNELLNGIDDDANGYVDDLHGWNFLNQSADANDTNGRGTELASLIVDRNAVAGVAPDATILPLKFMADDGTGEVKHAIEALDYASRSGAKIIFASWGGLAETPALKAKLEELSQKDILVVTPAGNEGIDLSLSPEYPASYKIATLMKVAATSSQDFLTNYSNYGELVDLGAPGQQLYVQGLKQQGWREGTSFASALVVGAAALVWEKNPKLKAVDVKTKLMSAAKRMSAPIAGGRLDIWAALQSN